MLASAAVIGRAFAFTDLAAVVGRDEDDLFDALEAGERAHLIEELPVDREAQYLFVHEQIRQTLVGELSLARRQRVHLRVADAIAATGSTVDVAHHLLSAGPAAPPERTVAALVAAARANIEALAFEDALRPIDHALQLTDDAGRPELCLLRVSALRGAGRVDDALGVLDAELARTDDRSTVNTLRLQRVRLLNDQYRAAEGLTDIEALLATAVEVGDPELELSAQLARGRAHYILSLDQTAQAEQARDAYEAAYEIAKRRGDKANMARAQGDLDAAAASAERGLPIAVSMNFGSAVWRLRMVHSIALGEPTDQAAAEFTALAERIPDPDLRAHFERQALAPG